MESKKKAVADDAGDSMSYEEFAEGSKKLKNMATKAGIEVPQWYVTTHVLLPFLIPIPSPSSRFTSQLI